MVLSELLDAFHLLEIAFDFSNFFLHIDFKIYKVVFDVEEVIIDILTKER